MRGLEWGGGEVCCIPLAAARAGARGRDLRGFSHDGPRNVVDARGPRGRPGVAGRPVPNNGGGGRRGERGGWGDQWGSCKGGGDDSDLDQPRP